MNICSVRSLIFVLSVLLGILSLTFEASTKYRYHFQRNKIVLAYPQNSDPTTPNDLKSLTKFLKSEKLDILGYPSSPLSNHVKILVNDSEIRYLQDLGYSVEISKHRSENEVPTGYRNMNEIYRLLNDSHVKFPEITEIIDITRKYGPGSTYEGHQILAFKISVDNGKKKMNVLVDSCHHAREIVTPEIALDLIEMLLRGYDQSDPVIISWLSQYDVYIVPLVNVDGYNYVFTKDQWWRKNRRPLDDENVGVDLNRNYDTGWLRCGGATDPSSEIYKGPAAFSEAETQSMRGLILDLNFAKVLTFHSAGQEIVYPYTSCLELPESYHWMFIKFANELADAAKGYQYRAPSGDGEHEDYEFCKSTAYAFLVETSTEFQPPFETAKQEIKEHVVPLFAHFMNFSIPISGQIVSEDSKTPISKCKIFITSVQFYQGEERGVNQNGMYHLFVDNPGKIEIEIHADGFQNKTVSFAYSGTPIVQNIEMIKN